MMLFLVLFLLQPRNQFLNYDFKFALNIMQTCPQKHKEKCIFCTHIFYGKKNTNKVPDKNKGVGTKTY